MAVKEGSILQWRVPLLPLIIAVIFGSAILIWLPGIEAFAKWKRGQMAYFDGHSISMPFLWTADNPPLTMKWPGLSIFDPAGATITATRLRSAASAQWWLYIHGLGPKPGSGVDPRILAHSDEILDFYRNATESALLPGWRCVQQRAPIGVLLDCQSNSGRYTLKYWGNPAHLAQARSVAALLDAGR
jgi:hypothetical protein